MRVLIQSSSSESMVSGKEGVASESGGSVFTTNGPGFETEDASESGWARGIGIGTGLKVDGPALGLGVLGAVSGNTEGNRLSSSLAAGPEPDPRWLALSSAAWIASSRCWRSFGTFRLRDTGVMGFPPGVRTGVMGGSGFDAIGMWGTDGEQGGGCEGVGAEQWYVEDGAEEEAGGLEDRRS